MIQDRQTSSHDQGNKQAALRETAAAFDGMRREPTYKKIKNNYNNYENMKI